MEVSVTENLDCSSGECLPARFAMGIGDSRRGTGYLPAFFVEEWHLEEPISVGNDRDDTVYPGRLTVDVEAIGNWVVRLSRY